MKPRIRIEVDRDLGRRLAKLSGLTRAGAAHRAVEAGGEVIADEMRRLAPVRTGNLRDNIIVSDAADGDATEGTRPREVDVFIGADAEKVPYAQPVEDGTHNSAPHPFARPAFDNKAQAGLDAARAVLAQEVKRAREG